MRQLIYVPIIHAPEDLGSQLEAVKKEHIARSGTQGWEDHVKAVERFWRNLSRLLGALPQDGRKVRIYQDGMPVCEREVELARQLAKAGSRNHRLVVRLVQKGALLMGTEDPELLRQERDRWQHSADLFQEGAAGPYDELMERRDRYIANRIHTTLGEGELGLVFIGALHRLADKLAPDIEVIPLINPLPRGQPKESPRY